MSNIFLTSDTHYNHPNIASKNCSNWESGYRQFNSLKEHNQTIVAEINRIVQPNDVLYHMGDWSFGGIGSIWEFRKQLNCKNIHFMIGNHDHHIEDNKPLRIPADDRQRLFELEIFEDVSKRHNGFSYVPAQDLFSSVQHYKEVTIGGKKFIMLHYSMRLWNGSHKGFMHVYGHSHDSVEHLPHGKSMDVGIDSARRLTGKYRPFYFVEVLDILNNREIAFLDHHDEKTNVK